MPEWKLVSHMRRLNPVWLVAAVAAVSSLTLAAGCSSSSNHPKSSGSSSAAATSAAATSGAIKAGTLILGTSADFPPMMVRDPADPTKLSGFEYDMVVAIMTHLNQKYEFKIQSFSGLIPAIQAKQLDVVVSDVFVTAEREKTVDFVPYMQSGLSVLVDQKNATNVKGYPDLCGKAMGVVTGSPSEVTAAAAASKACTDAGNSAINVVSLPSVPDELTQIGNGRLYGMLEDELSLAYVLRTQPGKYAVPFTDPTTATKIGMVVAKNSPLKAALAAGVAWYLQSPQYKTDATKWGIPDTALIQ